MKLHISELTFSLPQNPFGKRLVKFRNLSNELKEMANKAGTENQAFKRAYSGLVDSVLRGEKLENILEKPIQVRALAVALNSSIGSRLALTERVFRKIERLQPKPSTLFLQSLLQYYLMHFNQQPEHETIARWLISALRKKGLKREWHANILGQNGPKWLAKKAIDQKRDFQNLVEEIGLHQYASGRFMKVAKGIYYVEQLEEIPVNQPHDLLDEVQKKLVYEANYDGTYQVGHKILEILIRRAPERNIHDSWLNVVMSIAGDPRISKNHPNYHKWWRLIDQKLRLRVQGWLSKLDLRLFLEALENFSSLSNNHDLQRMFPSRKKFLEGLEDNKLVDHTRLYLSAAAERYLKRNYKAEHLPAYSRIISGDRSIVYVRLKGGRAHMVEGSHSCYLWIYKYLTEPAIVLDYSQDQVTYGELTSGMNNKMSDRYCGAVARITHTPTNYSWQKKAVSELQELGVNIYAKDVLSNEDYLKFKRKHGVM